MATLAAGFRRQHPVRLRISDPREASALDRLALILSYFEHPGRDGLRLALSRDGYRFETLAGGQPVLAPMLGSERLIRDPFILEGHDGRFHMVWTIGWRGRSIGYAWSSDLLHWSDARELEVMAGEPEAQNCWAPEIVCDASTERYLVHWSSSVPGRFPQTDGQSGWNHRIYHTWTPDFIHFEPTRLLLDPGFNVIDADILRHGEQYLLFMKNETGAPFPVEKNIRFAVADRPEGPYGPASAPITGAYWAEGPCAVGFEGQVLVYFDKHRENAYGAVRSCDLHTWEDVSHRLSFPPGARHGHVFAVQEAVLAGLPR